ncbi:hypothetical protein DESC_780438 [Desulfosarcina cetonica]|nr:hypothetical protein DESC_780438 [Desulfosarcina cetonica]
MVKLTLGFGIQFAHRAIQTLTHLLRYIVETIFECHKSNRSFDPKKQLLVKRSVLCRVKCHMKSTSLTIILRNIHMLTKK